MAGSPLLSRNLDAYVSVALKVWNNLILFTWLDKFDDIFIQIVTTMNQSVSHSEFQLTSFNFIVNEFSSCKM